MMDEQLQRELEAYGDGIEVGVDVILREMLRAYQEAEPTRRLAAMVQVLIDNGVVLDAPPEDIGAQS